MSNSLWPIYCNPPGSSVHGILQVRVLEWVIMLSSRGSSWHRAWGQVSCFLDWQVGSLPFVPPGKPKGYISFIKRWSVHGEKEKGKEFFYFSVSIKNYNPTFIWTILFKSLFWHMCSFHLPLFLSLRSSPVHLAWVMQKSPSWCFYFLFFPLQLFSKIYRSITGSRNIS